VQAGTYNVVIRHEDGSVEPAKQVKLNAGATSRVQ